MDHLSEASETLSQVSLNFAGDTPGPGEWLWEGRAVPAPNPDEDWWEGVTYPWAKGPDLPSVSAALYYDSVGDTQELIEVFSTWLLENPGEDPEFYEDEEPFWVSGPYKNSDYHKPTGPTE